MYLGVFLLSSFEHHVSKKASVEGFKKLEQGVSYSGKRGIRISVQNLEETNTIFPGVTQCPYLFEYVTFI